ncbi:hypothetical protein [Glycomyces sp. NPDC048151]|uniref:hypothetical protein n=1 Tax=Glycomyces sp. NPDC048151 TaxID=3364002 RepID=UPI003713EA10
MIDHLLTVEVDTEYAERFPDAEAQHRWGITCLYPDQCKGWQECNKTHEANGVSAANGPYDAEEGAPWDGLDEFEFHGQEHKWVDYHGWTVPYVGCVVQGNDVEVPDELRPLRPGKWIVEDDWDDDLCTLTVVREES